MGQDSPRGRLMTFTRLTSETNAMAGQLEGRTDGDGCGRGRPDALE